MQDWYWWIWTVWHLDSKRGQGDEFWTTANVGVRAFWGRLNTWNNMLLSRVVMRLYMYILDHYLCCDLLLRWIYCQKGSGDLSRAQLEWGTLIVFLYYNLTGSVPRSVTCQVVVEFWPRGWLASSNQQLVKGSFCDSLTSSGLCRKCI